MIQIVIDIAESQWDWLHNGFLDEDDGKYAINAILKGKPLPKGHKRLIEDKISLSGIHFETERDHAMMIGRLNSAPTIIEADRAESEG